MDEKEIEHLYHKLTEEQNTEKANSLSDIDDLEESLEDETVKVLAESFFDEDWEEKVLASSAHSSVKQHAKVPLRKNLTFFLQSMYAWMKTRTLLLSFLFPVIVMILIFIERKIFPFGESSFLRTDMYHQYAPFFASFQRKLQSAQSLMYDWNIGMGTNFSALYAYYLASPINWLVILVPKSLVIEFMTYLIVIKIGLCGLTFTYYLQKHFQSKSFGTIFFGVFYALSGYMAAYSWNIMWLDCLLLLPLILLGMEKLMKENKVMLYCITLGLSILSNYYISIMICLFMGIYFFATLLLEKKYKSFQEFFSKLWRFTAFSLLAGALSAIVLLPEIYALRMTASGDISFPKTYSAYFSIIDMMARHLPNVPTEIGLAHWPNIYCGLFILLLIPLYFCNNQIALRKKVVYSMLLLFFYASFSVNVLNFIWHGFHYPNSLPARQSFIYTALILTMSCEAYLHWKKIKLRHLLLSFWGAVVFILLSEKWNDLKTEKKFDFQIFYLSLILLALYALIFYCMQNKKIRRSVAAILFSLLFLFEAGINTSATSVTTINRTNYVKQLPWINTLLKDLKQNEDTFYRIEKTDRRTKNDGAWYGYSSPSVFSSTSNAKLSSLFKKLGLEGSVNAYALNGATPLVSSLFGIKYFLSESDLPESSLLKKFAQEGDMRLYENQYALPLGFMMPESTFFGWEFIENDPASGQNNLAETLGYGNVLEKTEGEASGNRFTLTTKEEGYYYVFLGNSKVETVDYECGDNKKKFNDLNRRFFLDLGYHKEGDVIKLTGKEAADSLEATAYYFSEMTFKGIYQDLSKNPWELEVYGGQNLKGTILVEEDGYLFTSIPYEKAWKVKVDGKKINKVEAFQDAFIAIPLSEGSHTIEMTYHAEGFTLGLLCSAAAVVILVLYYLYSKGKFHFLFEKNTDEEPFQELEIS
ncbi:copper ABC transporter permease [Clostridia bacterium]|nr:copper ABC transporter permease [Clostridia bacterium]